MTLHPEDAAAMDDLDYAKASWRIQEMINRIAAMDAAHEKSTNESMREIVSAIEERNAAWEGKKTK